jgi:hypothetical protein
MRDTTSSVHAYGQVQILDQKVKHTSANVAEPKASWRGTTQLQGLLASFVAGHQTTVREAVHSHDTKL